jgi:hypothetical protein
VQPSREERELLKDRKLILSNFPPDSTAPELHDLFQEYGVEEVKLVPEKYAVLVFKHGTGAEKAMHDWNGVRWCGWWLRLKWAEWWHPILNAKIWTLRISLRKGASHMSTQVAIDKQEKTLTITIPLQRARTSASGKTKVIASTHGCQITELKRLGRPIVVTANAFVYNKGPKQVGASENRAFSKTLLKKRSDRSRSSRVQTTRLGKRKDNEETGGFWNRCTAANK